MSRLTVSDAIADAILNGKDATTSRLAGAGEINDVLAGTVTTDTVTCLTARGKLMQAAQQHPLNILRKYTGNLWQPSGYNADSATGPELVSNGDFSAGTTGWTAYASATLSVVSGALRVTNGAAAYGYAAASFSTVIGKVYRVGAFYVGSSPSNTINYHIGTGPGNNANISGANAATPQLFVATATTTYISVYAGGNTISNYTDYDNISVREIVAALPTCYSDTTGSTPAVQDGTVACIVDSATPVGAETLSDTGFDTPAAWALAATAPATSTISGSALRLYSPAGEIASCIRAGVGATVGKVYRFDITVSAYTGTAAVHFAGAGATTIPAGVGQKTIYMVADGVYPGIKRTGVCDITIDNISVREVGTIATQATAGYRPVLRKGSKNLLTYSEQYQTGIAVWARNANGTGSSPVVTSAYGTAPDGNQTAQRVQLNKGAGTTSSDDSALSAASTNSAPIDSITRTLSVWLKSNTESTYQVQIRIHGVQQTVSVPPTWTRFSVTGSSGSDSTLSICRLRGTFGTSDSADLLVWGAMLEIGSTASQYVATTSAPASNGVGNWWLDFDGSDDRLSLSAVPFQMADDHFVVAGAMTLNNAVQQTIFGNASTSSTTPIVGDLEVAPTGLLQAFWRDDASTSSAIGLVSGVSSGIGLVLGHRKYGSTKTLRKNGAQVNSNATVLGATTINATTLGGLTRTTFQYPWNGPIYAIALGKGTITDAEIKTVERYIGSLSSVSIS